MSTSTLLIVGQGLAGTLLALQCLQLGIDFKITQSPTLSTPSTIAAGLLNPITGKRITKSWNVDTLLPYAKVFYSHIENILGSSFLKPHSLLRILQSQDEQSILTKRTQDPSYTPYIGDIHTPHFFNYLQDDYGSFFINQVYTLQVSSLLQIAKTYFQKNNHWINTTFDHTKDNIHGLWNGYSFKHIIFSEGYLSQKNPYFSWLPFRPAKGDILTIQLAHPIPDTVLNKEKWIIPISPHIIKIGATYTWDFSDETPHPSSQSTLIHSLNNILKNNNSYTVIDHQSAIRPCTKDAKPFIGVHPQHPSIGIFNGFGSKGTLLIPYYSHQMIQNIINNQPIDKNVHINRYYS